MLIRKAMKRLPLISEKNEKKIAQNICHSIANQLSDYYSTNCSPGLLNGLGGISCFFFHFYEFTGDESYKIQGYRCLERIIKEINEGFNQPSFGTGLAGINWLFQYLGEKASLNVSSSSQYFLPAQKVSL